MNILSALVMICLNFMPMFAVIHAENSVNVILEFKAEKVVSLYQGTFLNEVNSNDKLRQVFNGIISRDAGDNFYESVIRDCIIYNVSNSEELAQQVNQSVRNALNIITPDSAAITIMAAGERLLNDYNILNETNTATKAEEYANLLLKAAEMEKNLDDKNCVLLVTLTVNEFYVSSGVNLHQSFPTLLKYYNGILGVAKNFC